MHYTNTFIIGDSTIIFSLKSIRLNPKQNFLKFESEINMIVLITFAFFFKYIFYCAIYIICIILFIRFLILFNTPQCLLYFVKPLTQFLGLQPSKKITIVYRMAAKCYWYFFNSLMEGFREKSIRTQENKNLVGTQYLPLAQVFFFGYIQYTILCSRIMLSVYV